MFGPGTKNVLVEGLKRRQQSTSEETEKSEEVAGRRPIHQSLLLSFSSPSLPLSLADSNWQGETYMIN